MSNMVSRIAKVLNQAERAEEGSPEREAFMDKALALSQAYSIDLAVARAHQADKERREEPERRQFTVGLAGQDRRAKNKNAHFVDLMIAICDANDVQVVISGSNAYVWGTGMPSDLDMCERLFAILSVQMVSEADAGLRRGDNGTTALLPKMVRETIPEDERAWGQKDVGQRKDVWTEAGYYDERYEDLQDWYGDGKMRRQRFNEATQTYDWMASHPPPTTRLVPVLDGAGEPVMEERWTSTSDARVWRTNFYAGFVRRTAVRLKEAKRQALKDAGVDVDDAEDDKALAILDKAKEVRSAFEEFEKTVLSSGKTYGGAKVSYHDPSGHSAGDLAGRNARLGNEKDLGDRHA